MAIPPLRLRSSLVDDDRDIPQSVFHNDTEQKLMTPLPFSRSHCQQINQRKKYPLVKKTR